MKSLYFLGKTGTVSFDQFGQRDYIDYDILKLVKRNGSVAWDQVGLITQGTDVTLQPSFWDSSWTEHESLEERKVIIVTVEEMPLLAAERPAPNGECILSVRCYRHARNSTPERYKFQPWSDDEALCCSGEGHRKLLGHHIFVCWPVLYYGVVVYWLYEPKLGAQTTSYPGY